jgi:YegS/Rv2252/BmrU family lipid kinase
LTRALVIGRQRKGRHIGAIVREVRTTLRADGWRVESALVVTKKALESRARDAIRDGCDVVVAVGGDGAVVRAASAVAGTDAALGIIPTGTGNLLASNLGVPHGVRPATRLILRGRTRRIDMGRVTTDDGTRRDFAVACGIGYDADVIDETGAGQKLRWGKLAYLANAVGQTGAIRNVAYTITLDGTTTVFEASQVFVANFGKMLPLIEPRHRIVPDDGLLDVIVVRASGPLPGLVATWEALRQKDLGETDGGHVFRARARKIEIKTEPSRLVESDGNSLGRTPIKIKVRPRTLRVIAPPPKGHH